MTSKKGLNEGNYEFTPDYAIPPGVTLLETLEHLGMTQADLAKRTGRPVKTINEIIKGKSAITPETALQLERVLGVPATFWNNLERNYQEQLAMQKEKERLEAQIEWLKQIPVKKMIEYGWIKEFKDKIRQLQELLNFYGVASIEVWKDTWDNILNTSGLVFRKSSVFDTEPGAVSAWLRQGEIKAQKIDCKPFSVSEFRKSLMHIKSLTKEVPEVFIKDMVRICADAGIAVVFIPELPKCPVSGVARWLTPQKALIQLSLRYKTDDHLWFSFFHEAGHIILHGKREIFLEYNGREGELEDEANQFAADFLIPSSKYKRFIDKGIIDHDSTRKFAEKLNIAPGILVGRLQHDNIISWSSHLNKHKQRFKWVAKN
ncbi:plasmid maintenance system antidote protein, XRE family [Desulfofarcimen acetoxidans DSM 771]|uniref:Plasmid maintenance system antidote protein, XRE family n=1 Tax=Desulfofarcimen acetoxidans (strain ATCC 49208 / DSM 771 / KCTC 5769 / VKM B-1644 / 5575) TaxID=485916 RepID=C8VW53_DESAS|nr:HigA family addiction module antitoxin [Desulfofarcimen acetoxidans]ACV62405.1 plasmid maintenance system antidote protein, XRE family [Desulfofarcimen acetoxidans DSM 771]